MDLGIIGGADGPTAVMVASSAVPWGMIFTLIFLAAAILVRFIVAREFRRIARMKGHPERRYFWLAFLLGLPGWILAAALPCRSIIPQNDENCK